MKTKLITALVASGLVGAFASDAMAAASPVLDGQPITTACVNKRTGQIRVIDQLKKNTCRKAEVTYQNGYKVYDANNQFLGYDTLGGNDPYNVFFYVPSLKTGISIGPKVDPTAPGGVSLTQGDIGLLQNRTTYFTGANCTGTSQLSYHMGFGQVSKEPVSGQILQSGGTLAIFTAQSEISEGYNSQTGWKVFQAFDPNTNKLVDCNDYKTQGQQQQVLRLYPAPTAVTPPFTLPIALPVQYK